METANILSVKMTVDNSNQNPLNNYLLNTHEVSNEPGLYKQKWSVSVPVLDLKVISTW